MATDETGALSSSSRMNCRDFLQSIDMPPELVLSMDSVEYNAEVGLHIPLPDGDHGIAWIISDTNFCRGEHVLLITDREKFFDLIPGPEGEYVRALELARCMGLEP